VRLRAWPARAYRALPERRLTSRTNRDRVLAACRSARHLRARAFGFRVRQPRAGIRRRCWRRRVGLLCLRELRFVPTYKTYCHEPSLRLGRFIRHAAPAGVRAQRGGHLAPAGRAGRAAHAAAGGNAVDAAIATAAAMTIVEPCSNGLGSDAFCILWDGQQLHGLNASGPCAGGLDADYFQRKYGSGGRAAAARLGQRHRARRGGGLGQPEPALRQARPSPTCWPRPSRSPSAATSCRWWSRRSGCWRRRWPSSRRSRALRRPSCRTAARRRWASVSPAGRGAHAAPDGRHRRSLLRRRDRAGAGAHAAAEHGGAMTVQDSGGLPARVGHADRQGLPRLHAARDPAQRPGHRRADGAGHAGRTSTWPRCRWTAPRVHLQIEAMKLAFADVYRHVAEPRDMR
jgi:hypothetical protein